MRNIDPHHSRTFLLSIVAVGLSLFALLMIVYSTRTVNERITMSTSARERPTLPFDLSSFPGLGRDRQGTVVGTVLLKVGESEEISCEGNKLFIRRSEKKKITVTCANIPLPPFGSSSSTSSVRSSSSSTGEGSSSVSSGTSSSRNSSSVSSQQSSESDIPIDLL